MPRGVRIPGVKGGTVGMVGMTTPKAAERLLNALKRLEAREEANSTARPSVACLMTIEFS